MPTKLANPANISPRLPGSGTTEANTVLPDSAEYTPLHNGRTAETPSSLPVVPLQAVPDPVVSKLHSGGEHVLGSKMFIKPPLPLKLNSNWVAVAVTLLPAMNTIPLTPEVKFAIPVPSYKLRLNERMSPLLSVP